MFSEDNIISYCALCKKCNEVRKCPVKARPYHRQISSAFIPVTAIENMTVKNHTLFKHIDKSMLTIRNLLQEWNKLNDSIFHGASDI